MMYSVVCSVRLSLGFSIFAARSVYYLSLSLKLAVSLQRQKRLRVCLCLSLAAAGGHVLYRARIAIRRYDTVHSIVGTQLQRIEL